jgi:arsenite/tail-anchored protein-transporting ATPase
MLLTSGIAGLARVSSRHLFFTGKGGVGKTSIACATAVALADSGRRVLLASTDPASNLDEVLGARLGSQPAPVPGVPRLAAMNVDPEAAARDYRERVVGPYRGVLPGAAVTSIEEQLSGACTVEIAAFDEFAKLLGDPGTTTAYDHVVFDTAPTGHTLRLLALPAAWSGFLDASDGGTSCLGPLAGLGEQRALYQRTLGALTDGSLTTVFLVSRPESSALDEADRTCGELEALGVSSLRLVINGRFEAIDSSDAIARGLQARGVAALAGMPARLSALPRTDLPLYPFSLLGIDALRALTPPAGLRGGYRHVSPAANQRTKRVLLTLGTLIDRIAEPGRGVVMAMGKGGVGKTTVAAATAVALARRGHRVHLTTTDPAAHLQSVLPDEVPRLTVSRIDPRVETRAYAAEILETAGGSLDAQGRALLEEDLRSPCTEEIAVFRAFAQTVAGGAEAFVVVDTAPTGHTLLLLDAAAAYHREVSRTMSDLPDAVCRLLPRLRDHDFTRILIVSLPEATPVHEAARLQRDLRRAGIAPFAWVLNQSLAPLPARDPVLVARQAAEHAYVDEVCGQHATRVALVPWLPEPPTGARGLEAVLGGHAETRLAGRA